MKFAGKKYDIWITCIPVTVGLGCSMVYSIHLFDGIKTAKTFYLFMAVCLMLFFMSVKAWKTKKNMIISPSVPDILLLLYALWAFFRLMTSDTESIHNLYFCEFSACMLWYFSLRYFHIFSGKGWVKYLLYFLIASGYVQLIFCTLQLTGITPSFSPVFPVSGTFDNTSEMCIYLTFILPIVVHTGLKASDTSSTGKIIRSVCLFYILCWLLLVLAIGSRTALLSGCVGMIVFIGFQTGFFGRMNRKSNSFVHKILIATGLFFITGGLAFLLMQYKKDSANGRLLIWKAAWTGIKDAPVKGLGFNAFQTRYGHYQARYFQQHVGSEKDTMIADNMTVAMNDYVETTFNLGFVGLLLYVAFWLSLFKGADSGNPLHFVSIGVAIIFLVSSGFYFIEKMPSIKVIALFFAAYLSSSCKSVVSICIGPVLLKFTAAIFLIFSCSAGYATGNKVKHYADWNKANMLAQFGYVEEAKAKYELVYPHLRHNGLFLYFYARNLYENKAYRQCLEYMEAAKPQMTGDRFFVLFGNAYLKTGDYENAIKCYEHAASMVPNRFRPLYQLFKLYEEIGETRKALAIAQSIVNKPIKVDSYEVQQIRKECIDFIRLKEHDKD